MARTFVQQSQVSGSLAFNDTLEAGSALAGQQTLVGDLNALRSQINKIIGGDRWYDALSGSQNLADIHTAVQMVGSKANFQGAIDVAGVADFDADVYMAADLGVSGTLAVAQAATLSNGLTVNGAAADFNADVTANKISIDSDVAGRLYIVDSDGSIKDEANLTFGSGKLDITGDLDASGVADFGKLYVAGAAGLSGSLAVAGIADFAADVYMAADLGVSGTLTITGAVEAQDGLTVTGDRLEVTGSFGLTGAADLDSTLNVDGVADFKDAVYAASSLGVSGSLTLAGTADLNGALDVAGVADFGAAVYMDSSLGVSGSLTVAQAATLSNGLTVNGAAADFNAGVTASSIKIDSDVAQRLYIVDADGSIKDEEKLTFDGSELWVNGDLEVAGGDITMSNSVSLASSAANTLVITAGNAVEITGDLKVGGNDIKSSTGDIVVTLSGKDAYFKNDVHVAGDLIVTGTMTYIETENLKVKDAFIHLATGSNGSVNSGIVLHGGAGASADLMLAQDGGAGEFVFAKLLHSSQDHSDVDGDNSVVIDGSQLVPVWAEGVKLGGMEGSLSGSLSASELGMSLYAASGELFLESDASVVINAATNVDVAPSGDLLLGANGEDSISFIASGEQATFESNFPGANPGESMTLVGAVNELFDMIGGGSAAKGDLSSANVAAGVLTFSSVGTLTAAEHKLIDVYLNGVLLSPSRDLSSLTTTTVTLDSGIASGLIADDVITVVIRSAV